MRKRKYNEAIRYIRKRNYLKRRINNANDYSRNQKRKLLRRRTNSIYDALAAFNLRETIFDTVDEYQKEMNNQIRQILAARK